MAADKNVVKQTNKQTKSDLGRDNTLLRYLFYYTQHHFLERLLSATVSWFSMKECHSEFEDKKDCLQVIRAKNDWPFGQAPKLR